MDSNGDMSRLQSILYTIMEAHGLRDCQNPSECDGQARVLCVVNTKSNVNDGNNKIRE